MIEKILKEATINSEALKVKGVSNVIQSCGSSDIVLLPVSSEEQLNALLEKNLPNDFSGLVISPFLPQQKVNYLIKNKEEISVLEDELINEFYPLPNKIPKVVGVTGTNGKTSVCWLVADLVTAAGGSALYAGTPGVYLNGELQEEKVLNTTPSYLSIRKLLHKYDGIDVITLEVSSHALAQKRLKSQGLDVAGWTNFTQDHLDFHKTMEEYFNAKAKIFDAVIDGEVLIHPAEEGLKESLIGKTIKLTKVLPDQSLPRVFRTGFLRLNLELAWGLFEKSGWTADLKVLENLSLPPGRFQVIRKNNKDFIVDYAHTPDALKSVLTQVKESYPDKRILTVFGCGGDRDRTKRPLMGAAACAVSDEVIVTSDNPRTEEPNQIIEDIKEGLSGAYLIEVDRKKAIELADSKTDESWVILIAGKGHENYQEINGVRHPFDDSLVVQEL